MDGDTMNWEERIAQFVSGLLVFALLVGLGYLFATAFITENEARIEHNRIHQMGRGK